jgi:hypothetical protein
MAHATVGYCFTGSPELGGEGVLIGLQGCQAFRVARKKHKGADGKSYAKGDVIPTDCNVTGTDIGTPTKPKYALKLEELVGTHSHTCTRTFGGTWWSLCWCEGGPSGRQRGPT